MEDFSHLTGTVPEPEPASEDALARITRLAKLMIQLTEEHKQAETAAKEAKKRLNKVSMEQIPAAMQEAGVNNFELDDGSVVGYQEELSASIKDYEMMAKFLEEHGDDALLKTSFDVEKLPRNIVNAIMKDFHDKYGIDAELRTFMHPATLKAYLSRMVGITKGSTAKIAIGDINPEMCTTFTFYKTKVKIPK